MEWYDIKGVGLNMSTEQETDYHTHFANDFARYVPSFAGKEVLVVGCAEGKDCSYFVDFGADRVIGLDIIEDVGQEFQHPKVTYIKCSAEEMEFEDRSFDCVYSVATMEHIHRIDRAFAEMVRVTKPGGWIYCLAAPLWNSRQGHHMFSLFGDYPWIHLRLSPEEILEYSREKGLTGSNGDIKYDIDFMFSDYFNFLPGRRYVEVCSQLEVSEIIDNTLWPEAEENLSKDVFLELQAKGYSKEELLAVSHRFVAKK